MDEKVTANLAFFLTPAPALITPSPARTIPFPPVNKFPNKLAPKVPKSILKNPSLCSLVSFSIFLVTPFNKIPEFSNVSIIFIISFMSSCSLTNLTHFPLIFFCILPSIADIAAVKPNGANTFLANGIATFINGPDNLLNNLPKNPPDCIIFFKCALLNFISVAKLLLIAFLNLVLCLVVNNNSCGSSSLLNFFILIRKVAPSLFLTASILFS